LHQIGKFNSGKKDGEWKFFYENGNKEGIGKLDNGKLIGQ
jgi:antitoxin component YwqK of YwqJK toxin-antitoxin module